MGEGLMMTRGAGEKGEAQTRAAPVNDDGAWEVNGIDGAGGSDGSPGPKHGRGRAVSS